MMTNVMNYINKHMSAILLASVILAGVIFYVEYQKEYGNVKFNNIKYEEKTAKKHYNVYIEENGSYRLIGNNEGYPSNGYVLNTELSKCFDMYDNEVSDILSYENGYVRVISNKSVFCNIYFDVGPRTPDIILTLDNYNHLHSYKSVSCSTGDTTYYSTKYQGAVIGATNSTSANCTLTSSNPTYTSNNLNDTSSYPYYLSKKVMESATNEINDSYEEVRGLDQNNLETIPNNYNDEIVYYEGDLISDPDEYTWISEGKEESNKIIALYPGENYYQICFQIDNTVEDMGTIVLYNSNWYSPLVIDSSYFESHNINNVNCEYMGYTDIIMIEKFANEDTGLTDEIRFYIQRGDLDSDTQYVNAGYRYEGRNPNNYIWFNNEMWRIIGLIPTCTTANCGNNTTNLVKIIRNELIGAYSVGFDDITWSASSLLYQTLNNGYLTKTDVTSQSYCTVASDEPKCNFLEKGIGEDTFYGNMIQNVYWNTGGLDSLDYSVLSAWQVESSTNNVQGKIGMMSIIDYCYSSNYLYNSSLLDARFQSSWLYGQGMEWTLSNYMNGEFLIADGTSLSYVKAMHDSAVRPSLFLKSSVYVVSGDGSEGNPYQIAM